MIEDQIDYLLFRTINNNDNFLTLSSLCKFFFTYSRRKYSRVYVLLKVTSFRLLSTFTIILFLYI